jgi:hydrogenase-4 component F
VNEIAFLLCAPLLGGLVLAFSGGWARAAFINVLFSFLAFVASVLLTVRVVGEGPITAFDELFFVDPFNVFLVALTAFVAFTTAIFSRPYMLNEQRHGKLTARMLCLYHFGSRWRRRRSPLSCW